MKNFVLFTTNKLQCVTIFNALVSKGVTDESQSLECGFINFLPTYFLSKLYISINVGTSMTPTVVNVLIMAIKRYYNIKIIFESRRKYNINILLSSAFVFYAINETSRRISGKIKILACDFLKG